LAYKKIRVKGDFFMGLNRSILKRLKPKHSFSILLIPLLVGLLQSQIVCAQTDSLSLEARQVWDLEGFACLYGNRGVLAADADGDGAEEVVTGGYVYYEEGFKGQIRVYGWDGSTLSLEEDHEFSTPNYALTAINGLHVGDVDGDDVKEVIAGGCVYVSKESTICHTFLTVWSVSSTPVSYEFYLALAIIAIMIVCTLAYLFIRRRK
jgi:hypothetical protein